MEEICKKYNIDIIAPKWLNSDYTKEECQSKTILSTVQKSLSQDKDPEFIRPFLSMGLKDADLIGLYVIIVSESYHKPLVYCNDILEMIIRIVKDFRKWCICILDTYHISNKTIHRIEHSQGHIVIANKNCFICKMDNPQDIDKQLIKLFLLKYNHTVNNPLMRHLCRNIILTGDLEQLPKIPDGLKIIQDKYMLVQGCLIDMNTIHDKPDNILILGDYIHWCYNKRLFICTKYNSFNINFVNEEYQREANNREYFE